MATEAPPEELVEAAFLLLARHTATENPEMFAVFEDQFATLGAASRNSTLAEAAAQIGTRLPAAAFPVDPRTVAWAQTHAARRVVQVSNTTRRGIAQVVAESLWKQAGPAGAGRAIRPELVLEDALRGIELTAGLDARRAGAVFRFREDLIARGRTVADADRLTATFAKRQLAKRADTIARTEMRAATEAAREEQERRFGATEKRWATVGDSEVDDPCLANEQMGWIPVDQGFSTAAGPPQHPNCRCHVEFRGMTPEQIREQLAGIGV